jgi:hypothetical protein
MDARQLHHHWKRIRFIRPWFIFALAGICLVVSVLALRENNLKMVQLRDAVYTADKNNGDVAGALTNLQRYVTAHMNTSLSAGNTSVYPPIQLKYTYDRLRATSLQANNEQVYNDAQKTCEQQNPTDFSGRNRVPCIEAYVEAHGVQTKPIPDSMYKFDFISPTWSPDFAGYSLLAAAFFGLVGLIWWLIVRHIRRRVN